MAAKVQDPDPERHYLKFEYPDISIFTGSS